MTNEISEKKCCKNISNTFYYPAINEEGWKCSCGFKFGFRPDLDKKMLYTKIDGILQDLVSNGFVWVSNGTSGICIVNNVMQRCLKEDRFDQYSILLFLFQEGNIDVEGHAKFWRERRLEATKK